MGVVYLAEHPSLGRKAAVKVLHARLAAEPSVVSRFFHAARASNAIRHPNIVEAFDYGTLPDGNSYIVMEYLEGENLASRLSQVGRLPVRLALDFANQAAGALAAAHAKGIVHRDLKPDNLFMSPEPCLGVKEVDRRTDIYSLGCILYEMLCGAPPFVSEGFGALVNMHINQPPEPPSKHSPQISPGVERLVLKMLAKNADERFQSMDAVREALGVEIARAPTYRPGDTAPPEERPRRYSSSATTLSEAAAVAAGTVPPRGGSRRALGVGAIAVAIVAVVAVAALRRGPSSTSAPAAPPPPPPVLSVTPAPAPAAPAVPAPAAAAATAPAAVEVVLDSNPEGALVSAEGVAIGTTPMKWQVAPTGNPRTLTFKLAGYRTEIMQANPAAGLRLRPTLERQAAHRSHSKPSLSPRPGSPVDDIKSER